jgi:hypothetical protein
LDESWQVSTAPIRSTPVLAANWSAQAPFSSTVNGALFFGKHEKEWVS